MEYPEIWAEVHTYVTERFSGSVEEAIFEVRNSGSWELAPLKALCDWYGLDWDEYDSPEEVAWALESELGEAWWDFPEDE